MVIIYGHHTVWFGGATLLPKILQYNDHEDDISMRLRPETHHAMRFTSNLLRGAKHEYHELHFFCNVETMTTEIRFWYRKYYMRIQTNFETSLEATGCRCKMKVKKLCLQWNERATLIYTAGNNNKCRFPLRRDKSFFRNRDDSYLSRRMIIDNSAGWLSRRDDHFYPFFTWDNFQPVLNLYYYNRGRSPRINHPAARHGFLVTINVTR